MSRFSPDWDTLLTEAQRARARSIRESDGENGTLAVHRILRDVLSTMDPPKGIGREFKNDQLQFYDDYLAVLLAAKLAADDV